MRLLRSCLLAVLLPLFCNAQLGSRLSQASQAAAAKGDFLPALAELDAALRTNPQDEAALTFRGNLYNKTKQPEKALTDARRARSLNPKNETASFVAGTALLLLHQEKDAIKYFDTALVLKPGWLQARQFRGKLLVQTGSYEAAIRDLDQVIDQEPKGPEAYLLRARAYVKTGHSVPEALMDYMQVTKLAPEGSPVYLLAREEIQGPMELYEEAKAAGASAGLMLAPPEKKPEAGKPALEAVRQSSAIQSRHWEVLNALQEEMSAQSAKLAVARRDGEWQDFEAAKRALIKNLEQQDAVHTATLKALGNLNLPADPQILRLLRDSQMRNLESLQLARDAKM